ncbi:MAG: hypothetical protein QOG49_1771 [Frankiaceae bacterium]|nr:hypothetical protein [Frankiaceae bacterium]
MDLLPETVGRIDRAVGEGLERLQRGHHERRLRHLSQSGALHPAGAGLWATTGTPPRQGNSLEVLIDGERALGAIAAALLAAQSHVHIASWSLTPEFVLTRDGGVPPLRELLAQLAERVEVRVLLWAGPPVPAFEPTRRMVKHVRAALTEGTKVQCVLDSRERTMHCHHEKLVIVDDNVAFVGGIDLTSLQGDRLDTSDHPARPDISWHDVGTRLHGPVVADVGAHFVHRWNEAAGQHLPLPTPPAVAGDVEVQLLRTVPERTYTFAQRGEFGILEAYFRALRSAEKLIYLENQFLWSTEIAQVLMDKLRHPPSDDFRLVVVLPSKPNNGADTTRGQLGRLVEADDHAGRLLAATRHSHGGADTCGLYVHAKVGIVDDRWLTVGSANLNEHSLFNDTEVNVATCDAALARRTRLELWSEHLQRPIDEIDGDPTTVVDELWKPIAKEQLHRRRSGEPLTHWLMELPAVSKRAKRLLGPMEGLLVDG